MSWGRLGVVTRGLWHLRRAPDLGALRSARSPDRLARATPIPADRNPGTAIVMANNLDSPRARTAAELADDLRDNELVLYGPGDRKELTQVVMLWLLTPALGGFASLAELGPGTPCRGTCAAMAYMTITTTAFVCAAIGAPPSYTRPFSAAVLATLSPAHWGTIIERVRHSVDEAIHRLLDTPPDCAAGPLVFDAAFALVRARPAGLDNPYTAGGHS